MNICAIFKQIYFCVKTCYGYLFGNFWKQFGYFSFQHLVTLMQHLVCAKDWLNENIFWHRRRRTLAENLSRKNVFARNANSSVTRWLNDFSILGHLQKWKFATYHKNCQSRFKFGQNHNKPSKKSHILPKWWNFAKSGCTASPCRCAP